MSTLLLRKTLLAFFAVTCLGSVSIAQVKLCATTTESEDKVIVQLVVENFTDVSAYQFGLAWDRDQFEFEGVSDLNPNLQGLSQNLFSPVTENIPDQLELIRTLWFHPAADSESLEDGSSLFTVTLLKSGETGSGFVGIASPDDFSIEFANFNALSMDVEIDGDDCNVVYFSQLLNNSNLIETKVSVAPNPALESISFNSENTLNGQVQIFNSNGKLILTDNLRSNAQTINVENLSSGVYQFVYLSEDNKERGFGRFVKI